MTRTMIDQASYELDKEISELFAGINLSKVEEGLPWSYSHRSMSEDYDKGWEVGFRRCLVAVRKAISEAKK